MGKEEIEERCVQHFLRWYNKQYKGNYVHKRAEAFFSDLKGGVRWEFVAYEPHNPGTWIAIEVKELPSLMELDVEFKFWRSLCEELTKIECEIKGKFMIYFPPSLKVEQRKRAKLRQAIMDVLHNKESIMKPDEFTDIGPDIADKFSDWPKQRSDRDEWDRWGKCRPCKLEITKSPASGYEVRVALSGAKIRSVPERHEKALDKVFGNKFVKANKQLKLAKEKGARKTALLLACSPFDNEGLIRNHIQNLERRLISDIDYIYLVDVAGNKNRVSTMYPLDTC